MHVPIPQFQEQFVEGVKEITRERLLERIEELIGDVLIPLSVEEIEEVVQIVPKSAFSKAAWSRFVVTTWFPKLRPTSSSTNKCFLREFQQKREQLQLETKTLWRRLH